MPPIIAAEVSDYGQYEPSRLARIWNDASPKLWGLLAAALILGAAVAWERWL